MPIQKEHLKFRDPSGNIIELVEDTEVVVLSREQAKHIFPPNRIAELVDHPTTDDVHTEGLYLVRRERLTDEEAASAALTGAIRPLFAASDGFRVPRHTIELQIDRLHPSRKAIEALLFAEHRGTIQQVEDSRERSVFAARNGNWRNAHTVADQLRTAFPEASIVLVFLKFPTSAVAAPRDSGP